MLYMGRQAGVRSTLNVHIFSCVVQKDLEGFTNSVCADSTVAGKESIKLGSGRGRIYIPQLIDNGGELPKGYRNQVMSGENVLWIMLHAYFIFRINFVTYNLAGDK